MTLRQDVVLAPEDGSHGPLLRLADDRLAPGTGYGRHGHRAVDVVAVVLAGGLVHRWRGDAGLAAGDVAVLRAGSGLAHDEVAGPDGARVLQTYLRADEPDAAPSHTVLRGASGWVDLARADARLWVGRAAPGQVVELPPGLLVTAGEETIASPQDGGPHRAGAGTLLVWQLATARPDWAAF